MNISYSFGIMDLFHYGHLKALKRASEGADLHVCGLLSDTAAKAWQGSIVSNEEERRAVLEGIRCIDWVMPQKTLDPTENLKKLHYIYPEANITLFRGDDIAVLAASAYLQKIGGRVEFLDYYARLSPMAILEVLNQRTERIERHAEVVSTKANTLLALRERVRHSRIEPIHIVTVRELMETPDAMAEHVREVFQGAPVVVRSSSMREDSFDTSNAGHYESVLSVDSGSPQEILEAVREVYASYARDGRVDEEEQILIQSQTMNVKYSGVVFTKDIQRNRPYYVVNYDDSGATDSVTSGMKGKTIWIAWDMEERLVPEEWRPLFAAVKELEQILRGMLLDIEFAVTQEHEVVLFQVRPLAASYKLGRSQSAERILEQKKHFCTYYKDNYVPEGNGFLSDMAFWNPAEMIGDNPHPLDYSLYREVITHRAWNEGLTPMGYCEVKSDLMYRLGNKPYISVSKAFHSLIPASLPEKLITKLESFYLAKLGRDLSAHDKIEFEIALSCYDFATEKRLATLADEGFSQEELHAIRDALRHLTQAVVKDYGKTLREDRSALARLEEVRRDVEAALTTVERAEELAGLVERLLAAVKAYGTPQFARQARCAFIAKALADTLRDQGFWRPVEHDAFMKSLHTIAADFESDFGKLFEGGLSSETFREKYGHLRAGTYDITAPRYDQVAFADAAPPRFPAKDKVCSADTKEALEEVSIGKEVLKKVGLDVSPEEFMLFLRQAMEQREYFKYSFTKSLSRVLEIIAYIGERLGISRADMAYTDVPQIFALQFYDDSKEAGDYLREIIAGRKETYKLDSQLILPSVVTGEDDFAFIRTEEVRPNFITEETVCGETILLDGNTSGGDVEGKIILAEKADPGYDWIFAHGIKGFLTKYGGVASHMAIRCAEFGIPAAIGCGERLFTFAKEQDRLLIDAKQERISAG